MQDITFGWIFIFVAVYYLFCKKERNIWKLIGAGLIAVNATLGVYIETSAITMTIMYIGWLYLFYVITDLILEVYA